MSGKKNNKGAIGFEDKPRNNMDAAKYNHGGRKGDISLYDVDNNEFFALNQFTVMEGRGTQQYHRRPDVVLFINGILLVVIELKNPKKEYTTIREVFNRLETYKQEISSIFRSNELLIISNGFEAKAGSLSVNWERYVSSAFCKDLPVTIST